MQKDADILADIIARGLEILMDRRCFIAYEGQFATLDDMREPIMPRGEYYAEITSVVSLGSIGRRRWIRWIQ